MVSRGSGGLDALLRGLSAETLLRTTIDILETHRAQLSTAVLSLILSHLCRRVPPVYATLADRLGSDLAATLDSLSTGGGGGSSGGTLVIDVNGNGGDPNAGGSAATKSSTASTTTSPAIATGHNSDGGTTTLDLPVGRGVARRASADLEDVTLEEGGDTTAPMLVVPPETRTTGDTFTADLTLSGELSFMRPSGGAGDGGTGGNDGSTSSDNIGAELRD